MANSACCHPKTCRPVRLHHPALFSYAPGIFNGYSVIISSSIGLLTDPVSVSLLTSVQTLLLHYLALSVDGILFLKLAMKLVPSGNSAYMLEMGKVEEFKIILQ